MKACEEGQKKNIEMIGDFNKEMGDVANKIKNKNIIKAIKHFTIHPQELDHSTDLVSCCRYR